jgi:alpha-N-arabinofuranosidase
VTADGDFDPAYWVAGTSGPGQYTLKAAIYNSTAAVPFNVNFEGLGKGARATLTVLTAPDGLSTNVFDGENVVTKTITELTQTGEGFTFELENWSVAVLTT